ncbi:MAG TPA: GNAT family N-acetyltransferase [Candidatus Aenigmarchaeota archaeon]|nr:MAG: hypothetical protein DRP03_02195 [Candidatus Aenigmarchaeota archaeon]HDD46502.1 GNAT family N-acetyltransferase [Candidatus Aenigmarchaeota archaeon]
MVVVREAGIGDLEELFNIWLELVEEEKRYDKDMKGIGELREIYGRYIRSFLTRARHVVFVALDGSRIIGFVAGKIIRAPVVYEYGERGYISEVFVKPEYRNKGIGSMLIKEIIAWFKKNGVRRVLLDSYAKNKAAMNFYKKFGFEEYFINMKKNI